MIKKMAKLYTMPDADALEQAMQLDRAFFEKYPEKSEYIRLAIPGEDFGYFPPMTAVHVVNCGEGARQRTLIIPPMNQWEELERSPINEELAEIERNRRIDLGLLPSSD